MPATTLSRNELDGLDAYWRAANYLTVGQIYLQDNPLLREPLRPEHIKPRLLGHWGTPGLNVERFHVRGFNEEATTTTPFDMVVKNGVSRYHLALLAMQSVPRVAAQAAPVVEHGRAMLDRHEPYIMEHLEDMPEVRDWTWASP